MYRQLMLDAVMAREKAYTPYSNYKVGACLLAKSGKKKVTCQTVVCTAPPVLEEFVMSWIPNDLNFFQRV